MENASKALIIAGGVLISIIIISLFILMINDLASFEQSENDVKRQEQILAFNQQYEGYNREDVKGSELYTLVNKAVDYNKRNTTAEGAIEGNDGYEPITITIDLTDSTGNVINLSRQNANQVFTKKIYSLNNTTNSLNAIINDINLIRQDSIEIERKDFVLNDAILDGLIKAYDKIFITTDEFNNKNDTDKAQIFYNVNREFGKEVFKLYNDRNKLITTNEINSLWEDLKEESTLRNNVNKYNEYVEFKRAIFKCEGKNGGSGVEYSQNTGRIISLYFKYTGGV